MLPTLKFLGSGEEERSKLYSVDQIREHIKIAYPLTEAQTEARLQNGVRRFHNYMSWVLIHLKRAGLVIAKDRKYSITSSGRDELDKNLNKIDLRYLSTISKYQEWKTTWTKECYGEPSGTPDGNPKTPTEIIEEKCDEIKRNVMSDLHSKVLERDSKFFEDLVVGLVKKMLGGKGVEEPQRVHDKGIDGVILQDNFGFEKVCLQSKRWDQGTVSGKEVYAFVGATLARKATKGIFATTSTFTKDARAYADSITQCKIVLIDKNKLVEYMYDYDIGVRRDDKPITIKSIDENYFTE